MTAHPLGFDNRIQPALDAKADVISPSFTTPTLGEATATSINKLTLTAPATGATLTIADGKTLSATETSTLAATSITLGSGTSHKDIEIGTTTLGISSTVGASSYILRANTAANTVTVGANALTIPATGTVALLGTANVFTAAQTATGDISSNPTTNIAKLFAFWDANNSDSRDIDRGAFLIKTKQSGGLLRSWGMYGNTYDLNAWFTAGLRFTYIDQYTAAETEAFRVNNLGYMGIGVTDSLARLHVQGAASAITAILRANATTPGNILEAQSSAGTKLLSVTKDGYLSSAETAAADLHIKTGTDKTLVLDTPVYKDTFFPQSVTKATGSGNPTYGTIIGNIKGYSYSVNDVNSFDPQEYGHDGVVGGAVNWHVHWVSMTNVAAARTVKWEIEYTFALAGGAFGATTTSSIEATVPANTAADTHYLTSIVSWTPANIAPGSMILVRLKRITASGTAPATDPFVLGVHFHYQVDTLGSRTETAK